MILVAVGKLGGRLLPFLTIGKEQNALLINKRNIKTANIEEIWCILVHEHCHIFNDIKVTPAQMKSFSYWDWTKVIYHDEDSADQAETSFAQKNNFLEQTHPDVCQKMKTFRVDLKTATSMATLDYLMKGNFPPYQILKPYFPKAFLESIDPKYRDKIKFN